MFLLIFPGAVLPRNLQCSGLLWHSCQPSQPTSQPSPAQPSQPSQPDQPVQPFTHKVPPGGQKRTFYARGVEMAIGPGLWWLVFYHTKCFLALRKWACRARGVQQAVVRAAVRVVKHGTFSDFRQSAWYLRYFGACLFGGAKTYANMHKIVACGQFAW